MKKEILDGESLIIFSEGGTNKEMKTILKPFKPGAFMLAADTQTPIIPVAVIDVKDGRRRKVTVKILPAIDTKEKTAKQLQEECYAVIKNTLEQY